jgi:hypothetical protein
MSSASALFGVFADFAAGAADHASAGVARGPSLRHGARWRRSGGSAEGRGVAGGHPRFLREPQCRRSVPGASRHRSPSRDLVDSRTARKVDATFRSGGRTGAPPGSTARQAPGKDARQVEASAGAARTRRERCLRKIPRYSPLRKLATARRRALPRDGLGSVACNQICDEPLFSPRPPRENSPGPGCTPGLIGALCGSDPAPRFRRQASVGGGRLGSGLHGAAQQGGGISPGSRSPSPPCRSARRRRPRSSGPCGRPCGSGSRVRSLISPPYSSRKRADEPGGQREWPGPTSTSTRPGRASSSAVGSHAENLFAQMLFACELNPESVMCVGYTDTRLGDERFALTRTAARSSSSSATPGAPDDAAGTKRWSTIWASVRLLTRASA